MQRLSDARILHAWVQEVSGSVVLLRSPVPSIHTGERFQCRVPLNDIDSVFQAEAVKSERGMGLVVDGVPKSEAPTGDVRYFYDTGRVVIGDIEFSTLDLSPTGIGTLCPVSLPLASFHQMQVETGVGSITMEAEVRSRRAMPDGRFRIGFRIHSMDRIDRGRWNVLMSNPETRVAPKASGPGQKGNAVTVS